MEPVTRANCLNLNLLHSAASQPYQECFGRELYPTLAAKAAYLFMHLASGHIFGNGNKRTAALCLDQFLLANSTYLTLSNDEVHDLAQDVASFGERGEKFADVLTRTTALIEKNLVPLSVFRLRSPKYYRLLHQTKNIIRTVRVNQPDTPLAQRR
ncbi:type II toxin-antitoxin system death-on-curing family toxin [Tunturiibacter lichenicola]|uniref:type II toxin-antitoxin system death-on-curing family toxin n=1 Tax=Tunturiibacter lichenicola TaxID=2051959 RepID=UPI003D9B8490